MMFPRDATSTSSQKPNPTPFSWQPTGNFKGADGLWSTFGINVGDDGTGTVGQSFEILISTAGSSTWVPLSVDWCTVPDNNTCAEDRGIQLYHAQQSSGFQSSDSTTWRDLGTFNLDTDSNLAYGNDTQNHKGQFGSDNVGLGYASGTSPILQSQLVAGLHTMDWFMGIFGLSNTPLNFGDKALATFLNVFNSSGNIPSLSYGFTAGAHHQNKGVTGSLTLGGYDSSRFSTDSKNSMSFTMPGSGNGSLILNVDAISVITNPSSNPNTITTTGGEPSGFYATVDSTLPYLWLPQDVCDQMKSVFNLDFDNKTQLYTISANNDKQNKNNSPLINFKLSNSASSTSSITISLPYDAFSLTASWPLYSTDTLYFPIKASSPGNYVLGRTFLQEAYIIVDYERQNFTVAQAAFNDPMPNPTIVAIQPSNGSPTPISSPGSTPGSSKGGLSAGAIAGVAIAGVVCLIVAAILFYFFRRQKLKTRQPITVINRPDDQILPGSPPPYGDPTKTRRISELDTPTPGYASSRTSSQGGGYFGGISPDSPEMGSVEMRMKQDPGYFADPVTRMRASSEANSIVSQEGPFELPAEHGFSEVSNDPQTPMRTTNQIPVRPQMNRRKRSNGSGGNHASSDIPRPEAIAEDPNEGASPVSPEAVGYTGTTSRFQEDLSDGQDEEDEIAHPQEQAVPLIRYSSDPDHPDRPNPRERMSVDEAVGLDAGEPGPVLLDHMEVPGSPSISRASSITIAEPMSKDEDMRP